MAYTPHTQEDVQTMLAAAGAESLDDLFRDIPSDLLLKEPLDIPSYSEFEIERYFTERADENNVYPPGKSFLGAGAYRHFIPSAAQYLMTRGEFMTCYTPYQAEVSQGTLQTIFEYQSHICALTAMEVANASMYDGATALAEALAMAVRQKRKDVVYLPELLHPHYRQVCEAFLRGINVEIKTIPASHSATHFDAVEKPTEASAVVIATPNAIGSIEDGEAARSLADRAGALLIACVNPTSLAVLTPPGDYGADVAVGEGQPLGIPISYGGPYAGFMASTKKLIRKMPGRIVGQTRDKDGNEGFVLTLQTREQHIRRDKATSNICTNQGLFAALSTMYITFLGKDGLIEVAETSLLRTQQLVERLTAETGAELFNESPYFHEAAIRLPIPAADFIAAMKEQGILAGFDLAKWNFNDHLLLINCTELVREIDIEHYIGAAKQCLENAVV